MANQPYTHENEEWRDIPGWEGSYQASSMGRIRGIPRTIKATNRELNLKGKVFSPLLYRGRLSVCLKRTGEPPKGRHFVHRLVCAAFHGPQPKGRPIVAHGDGNPLNNCPENLRWATQSKNMADARRHGTIFNRGNGHGKYSIEVVRVLNRAFEKGIRMTDLEYIFDIPLGTLYRLARDWRAAP